MIGVLRDAFEADRVDIRSLDRGVFAPPSEKRFARFSFLGWAA
jgi:hypothetical protein